MSSKSKNILAYTALAIALLVFASSAYSLLGISHFVGQSFTGWVLVVLAVLGVVVTVKVLKGKQDKSNKKVNRRLKLDKQSIITLIIVLFVAIFVMDSVKIYYKNQAIEDIKSSSSGGTAQ
jgi:NADH:ubiquinone oxidoreductase subunit 6 (subunit J)